MTDETDIKGELLAAPATRAGIIRRNGRLLIGLRDGAGYDACEALARNMSAVVKHALVTGAYLSSSAKVDDWPYVLDDDVTGVLRLLKLSGIEFQSYSAVFGLAKVLRTDFDIVAARHIEAFLVAEDLIEDFARFARYVQTRRGGP